MAHQRIVRLITGALVFSSLAFGGVSAALADSMACSALAATAQGTQGADAYAVLKARKLYRKQDRPFAFIPTGVALTVRAPRHVTEADLYNALTECSKQEDQSSPVCVKGAKFSVRIVGGNFLVEVTSNDRGTARQIQERAEHFIK